ncbi:MAG TPA: M28 family peptidase, partial [Thermofilaceae archaeon]|nr:M28 family peptidase [Thermofilaceae archaeon]
MGSRTKALLLTALISLITVLASTTCQPPASPEEPSSRIVIEPSALMKHVKALASLGSRVTGYAGCKRAADYIADVLKGYGLKVVIHKYSAVVPFDEGSSVRVLINGNKYTFTAYSIWPNGVNPSPTPPGGVRGPLIYVGRGRLKDFDGKDVDGAIVLMDYESGDNWLNAVKLGAKAVIFIGPSHVPPYVESLKKFLDTPINFPRVYVTHEVGERLKELAKRGAEAVVISRMRWREVEAENIIGILKGEIPDTILLTTHYDSWSAVPALASSAHEAIAPAYLLELAKALSRTKPYRTIWFVFFSGHWEALVGPREFVERFYFGPEVANGSFKPVMLINIGDLDPEGTGLQLLRGGAGTLYATTSNAGGITLRYAWVVKKIFTEYLMNPELRREIKSLVGVEPSTYVRDYFTNLMYWGTEQFPYMLDSEPAEMTRGVAFTIQSAYASKQWLGSPVSDLEELSEEKLELLKPQLV